MDPHRLRAALLSPASVTPSRNGHSPKATAALIVEDGHSPYVLSAARSLGRAGLRVGLASPTPNPRAAPSRWVRGWHPIRLPEHDLDGFLSDVRAVLGTGGYDLVFGADDIELLALSGRRAELPACFPHAAHEAVLRSVDKLSLTRAAAEVGLAVPRTEPATPEVLAGWSGPAVVKSRLHWVAGSGGVTNERHMLMALCPDARAAGEHVRTMESAGGSALLQEPVRGEQIALSVVVGEGGRTLAASQQRTLLSSLARTSTRAETVPLETDLLEQVGLLLRQLGWFGLANLQFLRPPGGRPHLIDLNGRFYGSLALAVAAGADLPAVWARAALGQDSGPVAYGRPGVRFHALHADLVRARAQRRSGLLHDLMDTARFAPGAVHCTWSAADPRPGAVMVAGMVRAAARRLVPTGERPGA